jgi:hypothetical protein
MPRTYIVVDGAGLPPIWRFKDVLAEVRIFEDGHVAEYHACLAVKNGLIGEYQLLEYTSAALAEEYIKQHITERVWVHLFTLSHGYDDKYQRRDKGTQI